MQANEYQWLVNLVRGRYQHLNLSFEQAEKIYRVEKEISQPSMKHYFSPWEEWDYQQSTFRDFLSDEQFKIYLETKEEVVSSYVRGLEEMDAKTSNEIAYYTELQAYYRQHYLPEIFAYKYFDTYIELSGHKAKAAYLKEEYHTYLHDQRKAIVIEHFRQNRNYMPQTLKLALMRHDSSFILPDYYSFYQNADASVKGIADDVIKRFQFIPKELEALLSRKDNELKTFTDSLFQKYMNTGGPVYYIDRPEEDVRKGRIMAVILLDKEEYGKLTIDNW